MTVALWLLMLQGLIGAFDTFYYHEWKARLPARGANAGPELKLHAGRDFLYAILFSSLPLIAWQGWWVIVLSGVILGEIVLTLWDFVVEKVVRKGLGDVFAGERVTHATMGIVYGGMLAFLVPTLISWWHLPTGLRYASLSIPETLRWGLVAMGLGVFVSGVRDLYAAFGLSHGSWPWSVQADSSSGRQV